jgi:hypothetical protein
LFENVLIKDQRFIRKPAKWLTKPEGVKSRTIAKKCKWIINLYKKDRPNIRTS